MAEIVNLKRERKQRRRAEKEKTASANRIRFGRSKEERAAALDAVCRDKKTVDDARLDRDGKDEG